MTTIDDTYAADTDLDDDNIDDLLPSSFAADDAHDAPAAPAAPTGKTAKATPAGAVVDRALIRRVAAKVEELLAAPESQRAVLAHLLGSGAGATDLTVAVLTAPRLSTRAATDLFEVAGTDPMEAGITVAALPKDRSKALWTLLVSLGELKGTAPASDVKAALAIARAAIGLSADATSLLQAAVALGKRS